VKTASEDLMGLDEEAFPFDLAGPAVFAGHVETDIPASLATPEGAPSPLTEFNDRCNQPYPERS